VPTRQIDHVQNLQLNVIYHRSFVLKQITVEEVLHAVLLYERRHACTSRYGNFELQCILHLSIRKCHGRTRGVLEVIQLKYFVSMMPIRENVVKYAKYRRQQRNKRVRDVGHSALAADKGDTVCIIMHLPFRMRLRFCQLTDIARITNIYIVLHCIA